MADEIHAGWVVTFLAGGITFEQFLMGGLVDRWGRAEDCCSCSAWRSPHRPYTNPEKSKPG